MESEKVMSDNEISFDEFVKTNPVDVLAKTGVLCKLKMIKDASLEGFFYTKDPESNNLILIDKKVFNSIKCNINSTLFS